MLLLYLIALEKCMKEYVTKTKSTEKKTKNPSTKEEEGYTH